MLAGAVAALAIVPGSGECTPAAAATPPATGKPLPTVRASDLRRPAGTLEDGVLTVRLEARPGLWYPESDDGTALPVAAFAEEGQSLQNPGPLIRVPVGTEVRVTVRNSLAKPLTLFGLGERRGVAADSTRLESGESRELRFHATEIGTFYYAGKTGPGPVVARATEDSQLNGAIVVDPLHGRVAPNDRVFVISWWFTLDSTSASGLGQATLAINGKSWPHTAPLDVAQGDSLHWRWVNLTAQGWVEAGVTVDLACDGRKVLVRRISPDSDDCDVNLSSERTVRGRA